MTIIGNLVDGLEAFRQLGAKEVHSRDSIVYAGSGLTEDSLPDAVIRILERCEWMFNGSWWWFPLEDADQSAIQKEIEMGSSASAIHDDELEHDNRMRLLGLDKIPGYRDIQVYSWQADVIKKLCSQKGFLHGSKSAIEALIREKHARAAEEEIKKYFDELAQFEKLKAKFGG